LALTVDSVGCTSPCNFQWTPGSTHTLAAANQAGATGTQYLFANWSDGLAATHTVTAPSAATTYTATFTTQYFLTTSASPLAGGTITPSSGWYNAGTVVSVSAAANAGYQFTGFTGALSGTTTPQNVTMSAAATVTATFGTVSSGSWYAVGGTWSFRNQVVINHAQVSGANTLSNFPVLVSYTDANLASSAKTDGSDIVFTAGDGVTKLNHEIETYTAATGQLIAWVSVPSLSPTTDTPIYVYYGNATATAQQNPGGVWDANYLGVWHLPNGTALTANDSTTHGFNGTVTNMTATSGEIDGAAASVSGTSKIVTSNNAALGNLGPMTASAWIHPNTSGGAAYGRIMDKAAGVGPASGWYFGLDSNELEFAVSFGSVNLLVSSRSLVANTTTAYVTLTWDGSTAAANVHLYINGAEVSSYATRQSASGTRISDAAQFLKLGNVSDGNDRHFDGWLDEARMSNTVRTPDWITTEYRNQSAPGTFLTVGSQQSHP
jgi:hypothetical protein